MKVLFIGGNGNISWWCVQKALEAGHTVFELNRGMTLNTRREIQSEVIKLTGDIRNKDEMQKLFSEFNSFDVVCDFICYNADQARFDIELFYGKTKQFIFISSAGVYERGCGCLPFTEESKKYENEDFSYVQGKIKAEEVFMSAYKDQNFPVTIVRPGYTYDTIVPISLGHNCFTAPQWYMDNNAALIAGDGTNIFSFMHSRDFSEAFVHLLGHKETLGEAFHIASDRMFTWLDMTNFLLDALNIENRRFIHVPVKDILLTNPAANKNMSIGFLNKEFACDRMWCCVFDNTKIKKFAYGWEEKTSLKDGIKETIDWLYQKDERQRINPDLYMLLTSLAQKYNC